MPQAITRIGGSDHHRQAISVGLVLLTMLGVYAITAGVSLGRPSLAPHFVYLADAFLHGQLHLRHVPDPPYDLTAFDGRWYVSFPPLPAALMAPVVAIRGLAVSDIAVSVAIGACAVALFYALLIRLESRPNTRRWLTLLLGMGTPLWYCAALGSVWFSAHVVAVMCLCLYLLEVIGQNRPWWVGFWLGMGFLARAPVLLAFPLSLAMGLDATLESGWRAAWRSNRKNWKANARFVCLLGLGLAPALLGQALYNQLRFGAPWEFGYRWMNSPDALLTRQEQWGQFSLHFWPENVYTMLVRPPIVSGPPLSLTPDPWGMGLLFTTPVLVLMLTTLPAQMRHRRLAIGLWLSILLVQLPSSLYFNTGSFQFGYRFALDWLPMGLLLIALGIREGERRLPAWGKALILVSIGMHLWGVLWMYPTFNGQPWHQQYVRWGAQLLRSVVALFD